MSQNAIIINTPETPNNSDAQDWASLFNAIIGDVSGVLTYGNELEVEIVNDNKIKVKDGVYTMQGHILRVPEGKDIELTVNSGTLGVNRIDLLVIKYEKNVNNQKDDIFEFEVVQGDAVATNDGNPTAPSITQNNLLEGGTTRMEVLYELHLNETTLSLVDKRKFVKGIKSLENRVEAEFDTLDQRTSNIIDRIGTRFSIVRFGYGDGDVIDQDLTTQGAIYVLITGRWNSMHIISWDRGTNGLVSSAVLANSQVVVSTSGTNLKVNLTANGEYVLYRFK